MEMQLFEYIIITPVIVSFAPEKSKVFEIQYYCDYAEGIAENILIHYFHFLATGDRIDQIEDQINGKTLFKIYLTSVV